jgi:hypothetical protein
VSYADEARKAAQDALEAEREYFHGVVDGAEVPHPFNHLVAQLAIIGGWLKVQSLAWLHDQEVEDDLEQVADEAMDVIKEKPRS